MLYREGYDKVYNYYDDQADYPKDRAVQRFLLGDYFHDSKLTGIDFDRANAALVLRLQCCRDWELFGKGSMQDEKYGYILRFHGVAGLRQDVNMICADYINGRFKNTAWLAAMQAETKRKLYQFRIGLAEGFLDILFHSVQIRKTAGHIRYPEPAENEDGTKRRLQRSQEELCSIRKELLAGNDPMLDDLRLEILYANKEEKLPFLCRQVLEQNRDADAKAYAAWLLGKCGAASDRPLIWQVYRDITEQSTQEAWSRNPMQDRNFLDAVEALTETPVIGEKT